MKKSMVTMTKVESNIQSLSMSTNRIIRLAGETVSFTGLNSPYLSHQSCEVGQGHGVPGLVIVEKYQGVSTLVIHNNWVALKGDFQTVQLPAFIARELFKFPAVCPDWVQGIINVSIPDMFRGFDDEGKPVFSPYGEITAKNNGRSFTLTFDRLVPELRLFNINYGQTSVDLCQGGWVKVGGKAIPPKTPFMTDHSSFDRDCDFELSLKGLRITNLCGQDGCPADDPDCNQCKHYGLLAVIGADED